MARVGETEGAEELVLPLAVEDFKDVLPVTLVEVALVLPLAEELEDIVEPESLYISNRLPAPQYS